MEELNVFNSFMKNRCGISLGKKEKGKVQNNPKAKIKVKLSIVSSKG